MDGLITLFVIIVFVSKLFGKSKKKATTVSQTARKTTDTFSSELWNEPRAVAQPTVRVPGQSSLSAAEREKRKDELRARFDEKRRKGESLEGMHRPLQPSEELTPGRGAGSIVFHSDEGQDVCDPSLGHGKSSLNTVSHSVFAPHQDGEPLISADDMVRGFVMSEILTRPGANRWKR
ncbi:MAG: hypothetical protein IKC28_01000 [Clostridia bacterium]|nr:hypothetical protein [Clostridia bacterium]